jgi:Lon protease-like protein
MSKQKTIPLFPLGLVLMPDMSLPLHIFEERYKLMIADCIEKNAEFGVVYHDETGLMNVGCMAKITRILNRYSDGRMDILTAGKQRFQIKELGEEKPYIEAQVAFFRDKEGTVDDSLIDLARQGTRQLEQLNRLTGKRIDLAQVSRLELEEFSFILAANEGFSPEEKQRFLQMTDTRQRLKESTHLLQNVMERLKLKREMKKIFGSKDNFSEMDQL